MRIGSAAPVWGAITRPGMRTSEKAPILQGKTQDDVFVRRSARPDTVRFGVRSWWASNEVNIQDYKTARTRLGDLLMHQFRQDLRDHLTQSQKDKGQLLKEDKISEEQAQTLFDPENVERTFRYMYNQFSGLKKVIGRLEEQRRLSREDEEALALAKFIVINEQSFYTDMEPDHKDFRVVQNRSETDSFFYPVVAWSYLDKSIVQNNRLTPAEVQAYNRQTYSNLTYKLEKDN